PVLEGLRRKLAARGAASRVVEPEDLFRAADGPPVGESRASGRAGAPTAGAVEWIHRFSRLDLCITMRLHGLILAACAGTPFVALSDDPKVAAHVDELGLPRESCLLGAEAAAAHALGSVLEGAWRNRTKPVKGLHDGGPGLAARARPTAVRDPGRAGVPRRDGRGAHGGSGAGACVAEPHESGETTARCRARPGRPGPADGCPRPGPGGFPGQERARLGQLRGTLEARAIR